MAKEERRLTATHTISVTTCTPAQRMVVLMAVVSDKDGVIECSAWAYQVVALETRVRDLYVRYSSSETARNLYETTAAIAVEQGFEFERRETAHGVVYVSCEDGASRLHSSIEELEDEHMPYNEWGIYSCPWDPSDDEVKLALAMEELKNDLKESYQRRKGAK